MDLIITSGNFNTILADVTVTHPNPSSNQSVSPAMQNSGHFSTHREKIKTNKYLASTQLLGVKLVPLVIATYSRLVPQF